MKLKASDRWCANDMSQRTTKPTKRLVRPAKTPISLRIHAVWSESSLITCAFYSIHQEGLTRILAILMDVQANLNICWSHRSYCRFCRALAHMEILVYCVIRIYPKYSNTITLYPASPKFEQFHFDYLSMCQKTAGLWTVQTLIRMWHLIWVYIVSLTLSVRISRVIMVCHYHLKTRYVLWSFY